MRRSITPDNIARNATVQRLLKEYALLQAKKQELDEVELTLLKAIALSGNIPIRIIDQDGVSRPRAAWPLMVRQWIYRNAHFFSRTWRTPHDLES